MSYRDYKEKRLDKTQARKLVAEIVNKNPSGIRYSNHGFKEMGDDDLTMNDILNVIKSPDAKITEEPEFIRGSYRYRLRTEKITVVIAFNSPTEVVVVTAWRVKK